MRTARSLAGRRRTLVLALACSTILASCGGADEGTTAGRAASAASSTTVTAPPGTEVPTSMPDPVTTAAPATPSTSAEVAARSTTTRPARSGSTAPSPTSASPAPASPTSTAPPATTATTTPAAPSRTASITIQNFAFNPPLLDVAVGTRVTATNRDSAPHTWTANDGSWDSRNLGQNQSFTHTFDRAGTFPYRCSIHPSMTGTVRAA